MTKKSTATKTSSTTKAATKSARKSGATRTKLPSAKAEAVEVTLAQPEQQVEAQPEVKVEASIEAQPVERIDDAVEAQPEAKAEEPVMIEAVAPPARTLSRDELEGIIRREAYMRAQQRGFRNGSPVEDWITAESEVRARLIAEGASLPTA